MATVGRLALNVVLKLRLEGRASLWVMGNLILLSWNCVTLSRLQSLAAMVAVLMMWIYGARTRCLEAISVYICSTAPLSVTSRNSLYMLWVPVRDM